MRNLIIYLGLLLLLLQSCNQYQETFYLFDVKEELIYPSLLKKGFKRVPVDVIVFEKIKNDTTISIHFYDNLEHMSEKDWTIKIPTRDEKWIDSLLSVYDLYFITPISSYTYPKEPSETLFFNVKNGTSNAIYLCTIFKGEVNDYLSLRYYYPK